MLLKRILLAVISITIGVVLTFLILISPLVDTTPAQYGFIYFFFTALALACAAGIWLDKFMDTDILPK